MSSYLSSRDHSPVPLLHEHRNSVSLQNLSPRAASPRSHASSSPPPSFYRDLNSNTNTQNNHTYPNSALSPSPERRRDRSARRIQFAAPPPPIASSSFLPSQNGGSYGGGNGGGSGSGSNTPRSSSRSANNGRNNSRGLEARKGISGMDPLLVLERRERAIQAELQELLDAQSAGLVLGFGGSGSVDDVRSEGSSTPTTRNQKSKERGSGSGVVPVRQPKKKVLSLRGARRALLRDMGELVIAKFEEAGVLDMEIERRERVLAQVGDWEQKIEGVRKQLEAQSGVGGTGEEESEIKGLREEERAVDLEIREMEDRLAAMRARKRWLGERIEEGVNRRDAKMSSYRGALKGVEKEVREFLRRPSVGRSVVMGDEEGFAELPPQRRTLGLAREWWEKEVAVLEKRREDVERERQALEDGAEIWKESVDAVVGFEDELRRQMGAGSVGDKTLLVKQIEGMGGVIRSLEAKRDIAQEKGWNLLICAVGAELEAFREGEAILRGALGMLEPETKSTSLRSAFKEGEGPDEPAIRIKEHDPNAHAADERADDSDSVLNELNRSAEMDGSKEIKARGMRARTSFGSEMESDEGPNLQELMVESHAH